jgi:hypothetical protein
MFALRFRGKPPRREKFPESPLASHWAKQNLDDSVYSFNMSRKMFLSFPKDAI